MTSRYGIGFNVEELDEMSTWKWKSLLLATQVTACQSWQESRCDRTSKDVTVWCTETRLCLDAGHAPEVECPEDAVNEDECEAFNDVSDATRKDQVWIWNEETQTCEDGS